MSKLGHSSFFITNDVLNIAKHVLTPNLFHSPSSPFKDSRMKFIEMTGKTLAQVLHEDEMPPDNLQAAGVHDETVVRIIKTVSPTAGGPRERFEFARLGIEAEIATADRDRFG